MISAALVHEGNYVYTDGGFTCVGYRKRCRVMKGDHGLYIKCKDGHHYLDGQLDEQDNYVGLHHHRDSVPLLTKSGRW